MNVNKDLVIDRYIEELRLAMYEAYLKNPAGAEVLKMSQLLDEAINIVVKNPSKKGG